MQVLNLLNFLKISKCLSTLKFARCGSELYNFLDFMNENEQFIPEINLGIMFINQKSADEFIIVDGQNRLVSLSLLLHAVCECYKKTTSQNEKAIKTIRNKYLFNGKKPKLKLKDSEYEIYVKILNGERLSGIEKQSPLFILLHTMWTQIKEESLQAANIFAMLQKINVCIVETEGVNSRDLYYKLNEGRDFDQLLLIDDYLECNDVFDMWNDIKTKYFLQDNDIFLFLKDYFITKFSYKSFTLDNIYESFKNYFETMKSYMSSKKIMEQMTLSARLYSNILNVNFPTKALNQAFIEVKKASGEDTYAYILEVYEDYIVGNLSEETFIEILNTIVDYLRNRQKNDNKVSFNELIQYLNAFITCK